MDDTYNQRGGFKQAGTSLYHTIQLHSGPARSGLRG